MPGYCAEEVFEPRHRFGIEMVRRFVEQQDVGVLQEEPAERNAAAFAAREDLHRSVARGAAQRIHCLFETALEVPCVGMVDLFLQRRLLLEQRIEIRIRIGELVAHVFVLP